MKSTKDNIHPGQLLYDEIIRSNGLTVAKAAEMLKVTRPSLSNVLNGNAGVSPMMAIRMEKVFGVSAYQWVNMQATYELKVAQAKFKEDAIDLVPFTPVV